MKMRYITYPTRKLIPTSFNAKPTLLNVIRLHKNGRSSTEAASPTPRSEGAKINVKNIALNLSTKCSPCVDEVFL